MSSTSESGGGSAGPSAYHVMEQDLKPWDIYSLDSAEQSECLDVMKEYFTRYRMTRGEKTNNAYTHDALQRSWTRSIGDRRTRVCEMAQREWRLCYLHLVEGCTRCQDRPRPTRE
ncbi:hypothetical protein PR001_g11558 [Phytophthora rubi]|uniref:Uncharacterized protein n=1 Tax=Phytophthora rubi TaxID=129364 RepID=A0A6A3MCE7_9STRA|nr:hypothetical protein PR001_g11558 [Phytophthora rubi]